MSTFDRGGKWKVQGNIVDHDYEIESEAGKLAEIGKKWFRVHDTWASRSPRDRTMRSCSR